MAIFDGCDVAMPTLAPLRTNAFAFTVRWFRVCDVMAVRLRRNHNVFTVQWQCVCAVIAISLAKAPFVAMCRQGNFIRETVLFNR